MRLKGPWGWPPLGSGPVDRAPLMGSCPGGMRASVRYVSVMRLITIVVEQSGAPIIVRAGSVHRWEGWSGVLLRAMGGLLWLIKRVVEQSGAPIIVRAGSVHRREGMLAGQLPGEEHQA